MKIISLNIWDARVFDPLMKFFENNQDTDIFCLQEVFDGEIKGTFRGEGQVINGFSEIAQRLPNHIGFFRPAENALDDKPPRGLAIPYGLAIFVKKGVNILSHHHDYVFGGDLQAFSSDDAKTHRRIVQTVCILYNESPLAVSNFHGLWNGQGKTDTPERIEQSKRVKEHINSFDHSVILVGDFNLLPETGSLAIISEGMRNLIKDHGVVSTRSKLYTKHEKPVLFADYIFTTPDLEVKDFKVLQDVVSDHLPLCIEV